MSSKKHFTKANKIAGTTLCTLAGGIVAFFVEGTVAVVPGAFLGWVSSFWLARHLIPQSK